MPRVLFYPPPSTHTAHVETMLLLLVWKEKQNLVPRVLFYPRPRVCEQNRVYLEAPYYVFSEGNIYLILIMIRTRHLPNRPGRS